MPIMPDAQKAIITTIIAFILAFIGIAILGTLPPVEGPLSDTASEFRIDVANVLVSMATLLGGVSLFIIAMLRSMR